MWNGLFTGGNEIRDSRFESFDGRPAIAKKKGRSPQQQRGSDRLAGSSQQG
jgi:hypothetical protein